ncbi:succinate dehydrogenase / fumarate reductase membrane anchor subunit [Kushneria sinocarnis]|uniref:Succinate dehydrogenase hydrophobic membrane anchor subunit n=1 Tax=Kushneria sinocarnis TaxID=595502 RepID=A0A420WUD6_9GAMM|nr:succinate dehydrogenase, hydrophobic membrane anchor protein [Kushneria sinocarnis]RKQ97055.1 succinate dehydrogenase / fumarate reductase membrane anchor subunit [Kushneria sinocarnis]
MVTSIMNLGRSGVSDWLIQRVSAVILALYTIFIVAFLLFHSDLDYSAWSALFAQTWMKIFTLLALLSVAAHAWVGLWIVATDYIKPANIRIATLTVVILALFVFVVWGVQVLWGA